MNDYPELDDSDIDPEILLITNYFGGELSPREMAEVEDLVVDDDEFFARNGLLIQGTLLQMRIPHRGMRAALAERKTRIADDRLAQRLEESWVPDIDRRLAEPMPTFDWPTKTDGGSVADIGPRTNGDDDVEPRWRRYAGSLRRSVDRVAVAAVVLSAMAMLILYLTLPAIDAALRGEKPTGSTWPLAIKVVNVAPDAAPQVVELPRGIHARVMPGTRISFDTAAAFFALYVFVKLDGEASFEVPQGGLLRVVTQAADVNLKDGLFALRSADRGYETLITVLRGQARVRRLNGPSDEVLDVTSGFVRVARTQKPAVVTEGTNNFPTISRQ